ncbi:retrovirus-related pol polyprotein from transposon TNT 1-94 [Tanacetum coccineum]
MKIKESLNVIFDETPPLSKTSPLVDDDLDEEESIKVTEKKNIENDIEDETLEVEEIVNIKESKNHPLDNVIENLNQRTLRLVAQVYNQQEGIDYDETYAHVARLESIRILVAYACALDVKLFQMDVKNAFLNGFINEEVYVAQPSRFIDFKKPNHVYKLKKSLYGLKQAHKAWHDRLKAFLIKHEYNMGMVDNTLFTKKKSSNLIIVQIYVNDIIFGSTCQEICDDFAKIMHDEFEMSMMGELNFFLGLQIKQMKDGIFFNQSKYIKEMLRKFGLEDSKPMKTPISLDTKLTNDEECESVDSTKYRGMICSLLYLTTSRPDIMFSVCLCACFQEDPKTSHLKAKYICIFVAKPNDVVKLVCLIHVMSNHPELSNGQYVLYDRLMLPLAPHYERKTSKDYGTKSGRPSTSALSSSAFDYPSSSHHIDDDNDVNDEGTSRTTTPSPIHYANSLSNEIP